MATTIGTVSPYKKGSPPDFGTLYSGRALEFDGVSDYVSIDAMELARSGGYTISFWAKRGSSSTFDCVVGHSSTANLQFLQFDDDSTTGDLIMECDTSNSYSVGTLSTTDTNWHYYVATVITSGTSMYQDGVALSVADTNGGAHADDLTINMIGMKYTNSNPFNGNIANLQIWDKVWTLEDVQWAYTHPEGLLYRDGHKSTNGITLDNLKAWYPCTEGNPASPQTTVYDGSPKGLSDSIITGNNSTFASGEGDWTAYTAATVDAVGGALKIVKSGTGTLDVRAKLEFSSTFDTYPVGTVWKLSWDMWKDEGLTATTFEMSMAGGSGSAGATIMASNPVSTTRQSYSGYFTQLNSGDIITNCHMVNGVGESADIGYYIDNITLKQVKMGNHGTTTFTEIIEEDDASSDNTSNWTVAGSSATKLFDTDHYDHGNDGANSYFYNTFSGASGAHYEVVFKIVNNNATADFDVNATYYNGSSYTEGTTKTIDSTSVSYTTVRHTFTADATSGSSRWGLRVQSNLGRKKISIKDLSITQIGVASGWTTADAEPLIPQTALMGMSKPMVFDGVDDKIDIGSSGTNLGTADWSFSWWMKTGTSIADKRIFGSASAGWSIQGEGTTKIRLNSTLNVMSDALPGSAIVNDDKLHHYVMTMDRDTDGSDGYSAKFYQDGSLWSTNTGTSSYDLNQPLGFLGAYHTTGAFSELDVFTEISQWNSVLTLAHVQELFNDGVALDATTHTASSNLTGYWRNNVLHTDGKWKDLSTNSNHGTIIGSPDTILLPQGATFPKSDKDILGFPLTHTNDGWLNLSGSEYVKVDNSMDFRTNLGNTPIYTIEFWIKPTDISGNDVGIMSVGDTVVDGSSSWIIQRDAGVMKYLNQSSTNTIGTISVGNWSHAVITYDGTDTKTYLDLVLTASRAESPVSHTAKFTNIFIGVGYNGYIDASIDEVRIYDRPLTAYESDGTTPEVGETITSGEIYKNYKHGLGKHS